MSVGAGAQSTAGVANARPKRHSHARCRNTLKERVDGREETVSRILIKWLKREDICSIYQSQTSNKGLPGTIRIC